MRIAVKKKKTPSSNYRGTSPDMTTVFHAWMCGRFTEIQSKPKRKELHRMNQGPSFLGGSFSNEDNVESQPQHLKR